MLFNLIIASCQFKIIHDNQTMNGFNFLCKSDYGNKPPNMNLLKLIVFVKNGDRSPEKGINKSWKKRMCVSCKTTRCSLIHCKNGMLTVKGYKQGHDLGSFIKKEYYPRFYRKDIKYINDKNHVFFNKEDTNANLSSLGNLNRKDTVKNTAPVNFDVDISDKSSENQPDITINGYYYDTSKNYVFLKSILDVLEYSKAKIKKIKYLGCDQECLDLRNSLFSKNDSERLVSGSEFDRIIASYCNDVQINCGKFECDLMKMNDYLVQEKLNFEDNLAKMKEDIVSVAIDFSNLSQFVLDATKNDDISIVSVTNETLVSLLAGLNTQNNELVPYAGAVFIELWRDKTGNEFYSVVYNEKRMDIGMFKEKYVGKDEFMKFLKMFSKHSKKITEICKYNMKSFDKNKLLEFKKKKLKDIFDPLIQKLHEKRLLIK